MLGVFTGAGLGFERGSGAVLGGAGLLGSGSLGASGERLLFNAATGNLLISRRDEYLVGRGPDVGISRTYNSLGAMSDDNGDNWRQSTERRVFGLTGVLNAGGSTVVRVSGDGTEIVHAWDALKAAYVAKDGAGAYDRLTSAAGVWTWTDGDSQVTERYEAYGVDSWRITRQADTDGNALTFTYAGANLTRVATADGGTVDYVWSGGNITQVVTGYTDLATATAKTLTRTRYAYDAQNRLSAVTVDLTPGDNAVADGAVYTTSYTYHGVSKLVATITESDGTQVAIAYDGSGRVTSLTQSVAAGVTRVTGIAYGAGFTSVTDPVGQVTRLDFNADGSLHKITAPPAVIGGAAQVVQFAYNAGGDLTGVTDAAGHLTSYTHDVWGNVVGQTDRLGNVVTRTYGAKNELLTETRSGSDAAAPSAPHTTRYVYDAENHLRYAISAEGRVSEYRYTAAGELEVEVAYPEHVYNLTGLAATTAPSVSQMDTWRNLLPDRSSTEIALHGYDVRGGITSSTRYGMASAAGFANGSEGYSRIYHVYDQAGQLLSRNRYQETPETFVHDGLGRIVASTSGSGGTTSIVFNDAAMQTVVTLANGYVTTSTYNKAGELVSSTDTGSHVAGGTTSYLYDKLGRVRVATDATGNKSYSIYDKAGRLAGEVDHLGALVEYRYDANDRLVASVRYATLAGTDTLATLGDPDNVLEMSAIRPAAQAGDLWAWQVHDQEGRLIAAIGGDGAVTAYGYDASGRLVVTTGYANRLTASQIAGYKTAAPASVTLPAADAARDSVARSFYDKDGLLVGVLDGEGYLSRTVYDHAGRAIEEVAFATATAANLRATGTFDALLASAGTTADDRSVHYVYDGQGLLRYRLDALDVVTNYNYNVAGKVTQTIAYAGSIAPGADYSYDNVKALVVASGLASHVATRTSWAIYDDAGRLAYALDAKGGVTGFSYDQMGQVTRTVRYAVERDLTQPQDLGRLNQWSAAQIANAQNRVTRHYYTARGELRFTVDAEGYVTRSDFDAAGRTTRTLRWDAAIAVGDASTIDTVNAAVAGAFTDNGFTYDRAGRLLLATDAVGAVTQHVYLANGLLGHTTQAYGTAAAVTTRYGHDGAGRIVTTEYADGTAEETSVQYAYNGHGDLVSTTDGNGNVTTMAYDKAGRMTGRTDALGGVTAYQYNAFGDAVTVTDARGKAAYAYYDRLGRVTAARDAEGHVTETVYNAFGEAAATTRRAGKATNAAGPGALPVVAADPAKDAVTYVYYDRLGRVTHVRDAENHVTETLYTTFGEIAAVTRRAGKTAAAPAGLPAVTADAAKDAATHFYYDRLGRATVVRDAVGGVIQTGYDAHGAAVSVTRRWTLASGTPSLTAPPSVGAHANDATTLYVYDRGGRLLMETLPISSTAHDGYAQAASVSNRYEYDLRGNRTRMVEASGLSEERVTTYTYDRLDRLTATIGEPVAVLDASDHVGTTMVSPTSTIAYDRNGNVIATSDPNGARTLQYYDALGRRTASVDALGTVSAFTYDENGNLTASKVYATRIDPLSATAGGAAPAAPGTDFRETTYTYDALNRLKTTAIAGIRIGAWTAASYAMNAAATLTTTLDYDAWGNVVRTTDPAGAATFAWYDRLGRKTAGADQEQYLTFWTHDAEGNVLSERRAATASTATLAIAAPPSVATHPADRLTGFTYDRNGRRLTETRGGVEAWTVNAATGALTAATGDSTVAYSYTSFGQLATRTEANRSPSVRFA